MPPAEPPVVWPSPPQASASIDPLAHAGTAGLLLCAAFSVPCGLGLGFASYLAGSSQWLFLYMVTPNLDQMAFLAFMFFVAILLQAIGLMNIGRSRRSIVADGAFIFGAAASFLWLMAFVVLPIAGFRGTFVVFLFNLALRLIGVVFILEGAAFVSVRRFSMAPRSILVSGILFIAGGLSLCSIVFAPVGFFLLVPATLAGRAVYSKGLQPPDQVTRPHAAPRIARE